MTREETKQLLMMVKAVYPQFEIKPEQMSATVNAWHLMLEEYPADSVSAAFKIYIKTNNTAFAPSVSQIISCMYAPKKNEQLSEGEAWYLVKEAIKDSAYNSEERFAQLPPIIQRAVGGASMLRQWAMTDSEEVNTVIMSNFQRAYKAAISQQEYADRVPQQLSNLVKSLSEQVSVNPHLEISEKEVD